MSFFSYLSYSASDVARGAFQSNQDTLRGLENELNELRRKIALDDGPAHEWSPLVDTCIEYTDRECVSKSLFFSIHSSLTSLAPSIALMCFPWSLFDVIF